MDKMKTQLERCHQGKQSVAEYEIAFNQIVRFVPHVAHDEYEKARIFRQGLKASIRRVLGAFPIVDFHSVVEQALGVEVQDEFTEELRAGGREQGQRDQKGQTGQTGGPIKRKDNKHHRHQPYGGSTSQSHGSGGGSGGSFVQYRAIVKPGMGLVCFRCGDAHRRVDCRWTGRCSRCGKEDHKEVVCRQNPNSKVRWEQVSSTFSQRGSAHMMANSSQAQQLPMQQFLPATPAHQFLPAPPCAVVSTSSLVDFHGW